ncbi:MAG: hypothetical protein KJ731_15500 [Alphaproteobacteria bacterium]|nr:hypothetical protein [Alphaproteobacteria bacterium]MBU1279881.1 hypothetical protein [Alphaproteobacteria bacterium]MBU1572071.1 hypothetical protein [Alphaproteobacteria bacterium]MBU1829857.1 hypothetical protein [Alphaproteobacteria bacterium]MBU2244676.1 hypothetical protein [Alphaproteobacteria bacterium]
MSIDKFLNNTTSLTAPVSNGFSVIASDTEDQPYVTRGLYVGTSGNVTVLLAGDSTPVTLNNLVAGVLHPLRVKRVYATGLTAAALVGVY